MKYKIEYKIGKDLGLKFWKIIFVKFLDEITIELKNFNGGYMDVGKVLNGCELSRTIIGAYHYLSISTDDKSNYEYYKQILINEYYRTIENYIRLRECKSTKNDLDPDIEEYRDLLDNDLFKQINRDKKLKKLGI